jgi:amino acid transporter
MHNNDEGLRREIGVWGLSANMINIIVGAGIFALPAIVAAGLGASAILAYLVCGILVALIMLCFAEAGSKITTSGGAYAYIEEAFGKYAGFLATFLFLAASITADAAVANALADVLSTVIPIFKQNGIRLLFFLVIFSGLAYINVVGVKQGIGLVKFNTIAKLTPLLLLILIGWTQISGANLIWQEGPSMRTLGEVSLLLFFAFQGAESGLTVGGEVRNPAKTVPRSILIAVSGVLILYILIQITAQGVLGPSLADHREGPLTEVAKHVFGPFGLILMTVGAAISMFGNLSGEILSIPRIAFRAAKDQVIPIPALARVHKTHATPHIAIVVYAAVGFLLASVGGFTALAVLSSASMLLIYLGVALSVMRFRQQSTTSDRSSFRLPGGYLIPIAAILTIIWLLSSLTVREQVGALVFIGVLTVLFFGIWLVKQKKS